ncbi:MAG TPA: hypothetical protein VLB74_06505 [Flavobacterium sp.]|uniref:hypothetical protein n=1 Tax=Flavobacterium sp. TaxID=239 RepID=UPI002C02D700|nr:hypothetical protein [Flavobacterium sp.]HSD14280.1 hypothetical protein [Flavobacterium sp.]
MIEIQKILDVTFPFVETLLVDYGEFYPLASAVDINGEVQQIVREENIENDFPKSNTVLGELKQELRSNRNEFIAIAIFYDVTLKEKQTDAIAVFVEDKREKSGYTFYYPYKFVENKLVFSESWKTTQNIEILCD